MLAHDNYGYRHRWDYRKLLQDNHVGVCEASLNNDATHKSQVLNTDAIDCMYMYPYVGPSSKVVL